MNFDDLNITWETLVAFTLIEIALLGVGAGLIWAIIKVRTEPAPAMLTITLGLLTLVSIIAFTLTRQNVLATIAATGLGALAGSLTNVLQGDRGRKRPPNIDEDLENRGGGGDAG